MAFKKLSETPLVIVSEIFGVSRAAVLYSRKNKTVVQDIDMRIIKFVMPPKGMKIKQINRYIKKKTNELYDRIDAAYNKRSEKLSKSTTCFWNNKLFDTVAFKKRVKFVVSRFLKISHTAWKDLWRRDNIDPKYIRKLIDDKFSGDRQSAKLIKNRWIYSRILWLIKLVLSFVHEGAPWKTNMRDRIREFISNYQIPSLA